MEKFEQTTDVACIHNILSFIREKQTLNVDESNRIFTYYKQAKQEEKKQIENAVLEILMPMLRDICSQFNKWEGDKEDIFQEAMYSCLETMRKYEPGHDMKISTFVYTGVLMHVRRYVFSHTSDFSMPAAVYGNYLHLKKAQTQGHTTVTELADTLHWSEKTVLSYLNNPVFWGTTSLSASISEDGKDTIADILADENAVTEEDIVTSLDAETEKRIANVYDAIDNILSDIERNIIQEFFGLNGYTPIKLTEIAQNHNMTYTQASYIKNKALKKIQKAIA